MATKKKAPPAKKSFKAPPKKASKKTVKKAAKPAPKPVAAAPEKVEIPFVEFSDIVASTEEAHHGLSLFETYCTEVLDIKADISLLNAQKEALMEKVKSIASEHSLPLKIKGEGFNYVRTEGETRTIQAHLLMQFGVKEAVIEKATKVTPKVSTEVSDPNKPKGSGRKKAAPGDDEQ